MGATTSVTIKQQQTPDFTLTGVKLTVGWFPGTNFTSGFGFLPGTYPITWISTGERTFRGSTTPIPASSYDYSGLKVNVVISFNASLDSSGKLVYDAQSASLALTVTSAKGLSPRGGGLPVVWNPDYYTGYTSSFNVTLDDGTVLAMSPKLVA